MPQPSPRRFLDIQPGWIQPLSDDGDSTPLFHCWSEAERDALALARAADRPLLVRGEPGSGKTQLARAAARFLEWQLQTVVIHPRFEAADLLYQFDAVRRLADAQVKKKLDPDQNYWRPGPVWRAFDPSGAEQLASGVEADAQRAPPSTPGQVLLIDEIDKADSDLPNSLLEALGQRGFSVPGLDNRWVGQTGAAAPLVLITTNEERDLPPAFLRRCVVLNLQAPADRYEAWLIERGQAHHGSQVPAHRRIDLKVLAAAARQLLLDRDNVEAAGLPPPGAAEYLDLLGALLKLSAGLSKAQARQRQLQLLDQLSRYAFLKHGQVEGHPSLDQSRPPASSGDMAT